MPGAYLAATEGRIVTLGIELRSPSLAAHCGCCRQRAIRPGPWPRQSAATVSLDRGIGGPPSPTHQSYSPAFERLPFTARPTAILASSGMKALSSFFGPLVVEKAVLVERNSVANSALEFDELISTIRMAWERTRAGSIN